MSQVTRRKDQLTHLLLGDNEPLSESPRGSSLSRFISAVNSSTDAQRTASLGDERPARTSDVTGAELPQHASAEQQEGLGEQHEAPTPDRRTSPPRSYRSVACPSDLTTLPSATPPESQARGRTKIRRLIAKIQISSRRFFVLARHPRISFRAHGTRKANNGDLDITGNLDVNVQASEGAGEDSQTLPASLSAVSAQAPTPRHDSQFCPECKVYWEKERFRLTAEKGRKEMEHAANICPRECCVLARQHDLDVEFASRVVDIDHALSANSRDATRLAGAWAPDNRDNADHEQRRFSFGSGSQQTTHVDETF